ncbi:helix-turn-helix domain-containing protein [Paractinoplanes rishiriensis]|uniref:HTH cro/C1-type domain-containing protein n=1 Tax=Paractinoplanes rishiriensis TaxID=1050105 RepID=A0A919MNI2_9ACTN|nr:helix-turn-helix transcriptional regulator [Actinoplanes rishiriensis]GIE94056.1 hypothetical protein Ari01nite_15210 [Actinoplanes rishiriensis]
MPRTEKPVTTDVVELGAFAIELRQLRARAGLSYQELGNRTGRNASVLSRAAAGNTPPTWEVTRQFVDACGGDLDEWQRRWSHLQQALRRYHEQEDGGDDAPATAAAFNARLRRVLEGSGVSVRRLAKDLHSSSSSVSASLTSYVVPEESLVRAVLGSVGTADEEAEKWLAWRRELEAKQPAPESTTDPPDRAAGPVRRDVRRTVIGVTAAVLCLFIGPVVWQIAAPVPAEPTSRVWSRPAPVAEAPASSPSETPARERPDGAVTRDAVGERPASAPDRPAPSPSPSGARAPAATVVLPSGDEIRLVRPVEPVVTFDGDDGQRVRLSTLDPDWTTTVQCRSDHGSSSGWYYVKDGFYLQREDFAFTGDGPPRVPRCSQVNFPEATCGSVTRRALVVGPCAVLPALIACLERIVLPPAGAPSIEFLFDPACRRLLGV